MYQSREFNRGTHFTSYPRKIESAWYDYEPRFLLPHRSYLQLLPWSNSPYSIFTSFEIKPQWLKVLYSRAMAPTDPYPSPPPSPAQIKVDPILRNALRYTLSVREYRTLHQYLISRSPPAVRKRTPSPPKYAALVQSKDDYNGAAIRASLRVFIATQTSLKFWELIKRNLFARGKPQR